MGVGGRRLWCLSVLRMLNEEAEVEELSTRPLSPDFPPWISTPGCGASSTWDEGLLKAEEVYYTPSPTYWSFGKEGKIRLHSQVSSEHEFWEDTEAEEKNKTLNIHPKETDLTER